MALCFLLVAAPLGAEPRFIGVERCATCHTEGRSPAVGFWRQGPHAKAFLTLKSTEALKLAKEVGVSKPSEASQCLACHTTAPDTPPERLTSSYRLEEGVGCEACHGPGQKYSRFEVMSKAAMLRLRKPKRADRFGARYGLKMPSEADCRTCHDRSSKIAQKAHPNGPFDYKKGLEAIRHWR